MYLFAPSRILERCIPSPLALPLLSLVPLYESLTISTCIFFKQLSIGSSGSSLSSPINLSLQPLGNGDPPSEGVSPYYARVAALRQAHEELTGQAHVCYAEATAELRSTAEVYQEEPLLHSLIPAAREVQNGLMRVACINIDAALDQAIKDLKLATLPPRRRRNLPPAATQVLTEWLALHRDHPYASDMEKKTLAQKAGVSVEQVSNWLSNRRNRRSTRDILAQACSGGDCGGQSHGHRNRSRGRKRGSRDSDDTEEEEEIGEEEDEDDGEHVEA